MSKETYALETLLRPPTEFYDATMAFGMSALTATMPTAVMVPESISYHASIIFALLGTRDLYEGYRIWNYQKGLKRLPSFVMGSKDVPVSTSSQFVGRGFYWDQRHTQRLFDANLPENIDLSKPGALYQFFRDLERKFENNPSITQFLKNTTRSHKWWNPVRPLPPVGGSSLYHAVGMWEGEKDMYMDLGERVGHTLVLGTTRVGKTRFAEILIEQDIRRGDITIVFDPKGDADLMRRVYGTAKACNRPVYIFHLGYPDISCRYNAVGSFTRITEVATRIANQLPSEGNAASFKEFAWRFVNIIARALYELGRKPDYPQIRKYINNIDPLLRDYSRHILDAKAGPEWENEVNKIKFDPRDRTNQGRDEYVVKLATYVKENVYFDDAVLEGLISAWTYDRTYFDKIVASVGPLMEKLTSGRVSELLSPDYSNLDDNRPILDWRKVISEKAVVYVGLDALTDAVVGAAVGNSMFADLTSLSGELYKNGRYQGFKDLDSVNVSMPKISVHADEFNELVGDEFVPLLNKAGGSGFQVTVYTQTWSDVTAKLGNVAKAGQIAGNLNTMYMLRVKEAATAEMLTNSLPEVDVKQLVAMAQTNDSSDPHSDVHFQSRNADTLQYSKVPMLTPGDLLKLPKGQAFGVVEGGRLIKLRMPLPDDSQDYHLPKDLEEMALDMASKYPAVGTSEHVWTEKDWFTRAAVAA